MSGTINNTDITYTDDISNDRDDVWTVNNTIKKYQFAQTAEPEFTNVYSNVVKVTGGDGVELDKIEFYSDNSKLDTASGYGWLDTNPTAKELSVGINKADIFINYAEPMTYGLETRSLDKPFSWELFMFDTFTFTNFVALINVRYYTTVDNNDDFDWDFNNWAITKCTLKEYKNLMEASGLSEDEFYKRYPVFDFSVDGYYKDNDGVWTNTRSMQYSYNFICLSRQTRNTATRVPTTIVYCGGTDGLEGDLSKNGSVFVTPLLANNGTIYRLAENDNYERANNNCQRQYYEIEQRNELSDIGIVEFILNAGESLFNNGTAEFRQIKSYDEKMGVLLSPYCNIPDIETHVKITPYWTVKQIMKRVALFGIYFTNDYDLIGTDLSDVRNIPDGVYLGYMDKNGWTDGTYINGTDIVTSDTANKNITDINNSPYNPGTSPRRGLDSDTFGANYQQIGNFSRKYILSQAELDFFIDHISEHGSEHTPFTNKNAMQYLVSLQRIPSLFRSNCITSSETIRMGDWKSDYCYANLIDITYPKIFIANFSVDRIFNNFLDFSPYTKHKLYLPYIGIVDLPPDLAGKNLQLDYAWDVEQGNVTAFISIVHSAGISVIASYSGNCLGDITVTANNADIKQLKQFLTLAGGTSNIIAAAMCGNIIGGINSTLNTISTAVDIESKGNFVNKTSMGDFNNFIAPQKPKLLTYYYSVKDDDFTPFEKSTGYNCSVWSKLADMHGYTVVKNPRLGSSFMTIEEVEELNKILESGVDLP